MKIILADQTLVMKHHLGVSTVLDVLGHEEALVTDESILADFSDDLWLDGAQQIELSRMCGRKVQLSDYIWEVGKWIEGA